MSQKIMSATDTNTLEYYNSNAEEFYENTINVPFNEMQEKFLSKLDKASFILDFGCGSGRDTKVFMEKGHRVDAIDGSEELCKLASDYTGIPVQHMYFHQLEEVEKYDGIWACSSILHVPAKELPEIVKKMTRSLKNKGIIYTSFKYGNFSGQRNGRFFTDMTEETLKELVETIDDLIIEEMWVTKDVRPGRGEEKWLNLILRKK